MLIQNVFKKKKKTFSYCIYLLLSWISIRIGYTVDG